MPDVTSTLLAMYQQIIGGSSAREQASLEAECARRIITSGLTIAGSGAFTIPGNVSIGGTLTVVNFSVTGTFSVPGLLTVGTLAVTGTATVGGTLGVSGLLSALAGLVVSGGTLAVTGNTAIAGLVSVTGFGVHTIQGAGVGPVALNVTNTLAGTGNQTQLQIGNDAIATLVQLSAYSSAWATAGPNVANGGRLQANGAGGLSIVANDPAGVIRFYTGAGVPERVRITPGGEVWINTATAFGCKIAMTTDAGSPGGITIQSSTPSNNTNFILFYNSAIGVAGNITQSGATSVSYGTTSDARLKADARRAVDLTALRAVVVHDFTWIPDGRRDRGVLAQEAYAVFPRAIIAGTDETTEHGTLAQPWMTDYSKFVPDLIAGWQQHDAALADLRAQLGRAQEAS